MASTAESGMTSSTSSTFLGTALTAAATCTGVRIIRTAKRLGIQTVSIYTSADAASLHVSDADEAVLLPTLQSYTDGDKIIEIAKEQGCDAIIPGYGFLSENAAFAKAVSDAGLAWVGYVKGCCSLDVKANDVLKY